MSKGSVQSILIVDDEKSNIDILLEIFKNINSNNQYNIICRLPLVVAIFVSLKYAV